MAMAQVVALDDYRTSSTAEASGAPVSAAVTQGKTDEKSDTKVSVDDLYPARHELNSELVTALRLASAALEKITAAHAALTSGDLISSDNHVLEMMAVLPELFLCSSMGDGFRYVVSAINCSVTSTDGAPLTNEQVFAVRKCFETLSSAQNLNFDDAIKLVENLEAADLNTEPKELEILGDMLDG